jgi:hypothetical protein
LFLEVSFRLYSWEYIYFWAILYSSIIMYNLVSIYPTFRISHWFLQLFSIRSPSQAPSFPYKETRTSRRGAASLKTNADIKFAPYEQNSISLSMLSLSKKPTVE